MCRLKLHASHMRGKRVQGRRSTRFALMYLGRVSKVANTFAERLKKKQARKLFAGQKFQRKFDLNSISTKFINSTASNKGCADKAWPA